MRITGPRPETVEIDPLMCVDRPGGQRFEQNDFR